jgi:hypothetical protein
MTTPEPDNLENELSALTQWQGSTPHLWEKALKVSEKAHKHNRILKWTARPLARQHVARRFIVMFHSKRRRWSIAAAAAVAIVVVVGFWPGNHKNGTAWANVIRQLEAARTVHIHTVLGVNTGQKRVSDTYLKAPNMMRMEVSQPLQPIMIYNGNRQVMINPDRKLYQVIATPSPLAFKNRTQDLLQAKGDGVAITW